VLHHFQIMQIRDDEHAQKHFATGVGRDHGGGLRGRARSASGDHKR
jgi:hypothetical protein